MKQVTEVRLLPVERGKDGHYVVKRLKNADQILTRDALKKLKLEGVKYLGKNYDLYFEWPDEVER